MKLKAGEHITITITKLKKELAKQMFNNRNYPRVMNKFALEEGIRSSTVKKWMQEIEGSGILDELKTEEIKEDKEVICPECNTKFFNKVFNGECPCCKQAKRKEEFEKMKETEQKVLETDKVIKEKGELTDYLRDANYSLNRLNAENRTDDAEKIRAEIKTAQARIKKIDESFII